LSLLLLLLSAQASSSTTEQQQQQQHTLDYHAAKMVEWLRQNDGYLNPKVEVRRADPSDPNSYFGVFAREDLDIHEEVMIVPDELFIQVGPEFLGNYEEGLCELSSILVDELLLGEEESKYGPFIGYLLDQHTGQLPATWSEPAKIMFRSLVITNYQFHTSELPPNQPVDWIKVNFYGDCFDADNKLHEQALALTVQRGWDTKLIPIYDLVNHHNGDVNTENTSIHSDALRVRTTRKIQKGEEIFASYDKCRDCQGVHEVRYFY
jgi:hypothetical protein